ncbi:OHCU decarboxylase-domain-containing protein [Fomitopsis serialis]|uniref:OHCU decarboxylase-domain-containing protein n=1 Tax=Fomitopsis serialis TaxID=139415 RepID=UPI0020073BC7|nr:OHCU decarboxylase-domain-containing protein [Neoantrodia serialis]KAH9924740.1 OHCU decarboxylase-domain-containing protein [Neoantrodia serialis]
MSALPPFEEVLSSKPEPGSPLAHTLTTLFEASPILFSDLLPGVVSKWDAGLKASFIAGHPRIGEVKGLSHLSSQEQAARATPPEVLVRLAHLNACYEHRYPGLRYITFVNGRSRSAIKDEMEGVLGFEPSLSPDKPLLEAAGSIEVGSEEWIRELERAIGDLGKIAQSRLQAVGAT